MPKADSVKIGCFRVSRAAAEADALTPDSSAVGVRCKKMLDERRDPDNNRHSTRTCAYRVRNSTGSRPEVSSRDYVALTLPLIETSNATPLLGARGRGGPHAMTQAVISDDGPWYRLLRTPPCPPLICATLTCTS